MVVTKNRPVSPTRGMCELPIKSVELSIVPLVVTTMRKDNARGVIKVCKRKFTADPQGGIVGGLVSIQLT